MNWKPQSNFVRTFISRPLRWLRTRPNLNYIGGIVTGDIAGDRDRRCDSRSFAACRSAGCWSSAILAILPASEFAVGLMNTLVTSWLRPRLLPKLDLTEGIPLDQRTIVVVPCMLSSSSEIESLLQRLEMHFLANLDPALSFALLTDFPDAPQAEMPTDAALIQQARSGIQALNAKHSANDDEGPFFLFHRERKWNAQENVWMGWERKRGKLMEFNHLLRGDTDTSYIDSGRPTFIGCLGRRKQIGSAM